MVKRCYIPGCLNNSNNSTKIFITVPKNVQRRKQWFAVIGKENVPKGGGDYYCCEDHFNIPDDIDNWRCFQMTEGTKIRLKVGAVPHNNLFLLHHTPDNSQTKKIRIENDPGPSKLAKYSSSSSSTFSSPISTSSIVISMTNSTSDDELSKTQEDILSEKRRESTYQVIENNSRFYLGIPKNVFLLVKFITKVSDVTYRDVLISLKKIRLDDVNFRLSLDFGISESTVRSFNNSVPKIANVMQNFIFCPTKQQIKQLLPTSFRYKYSNVQYIIDCFEIEIQKPSNPLHQSHTWSEYKKCFGGRISDTNIISASTFLNNIEDCWIMADRSFKNVEPLLLERQCKLIRPPSVPEGTQLSKSEATSAKQIAALRVHIERVIRRIREYKILDIHSCINLNLLSILDNIVLIVCGLVNLQGPLIQK